MERFVAHVPHSSIEIEDYSIPDHTSIAKSPFVNRGGTGAFQRRGSLVSPAVGVSRFSEDKFTIPKGRFHHDDQTITFYDNKKVNAPPSRLQSRAKAFLRSTTRIIGLRTFLMCLSLSALIIYDARNGRMLTSSVLTKSADIATALGDRVQAVQDNAPAIPNFPSFSSNLIRKPDYERPNSYRGPNKLHFIKSAQPLPKLFDQLLPGRRYLTAYLFAGHANQVISIQKMLYLAKLTNRIAIIPPMVPAHVDGGPANVSDFYDLDRFYAMTKVPVIEMSALKYGLIEYPRDYLPDEDLGCWSIQEASRGFGNDYSASINWHNIKTTLWPLPQLAKAAGGSDLAYDALRLFDFDQYSRWDWLKKVQAEQLPQKLSADPELSSNMTKVRANVKDGFDPNSEVLPSDSLLCLDNTLFIGAVDFPETQFVDDDGLPIEKEHFTEDETWKEIGQHLHFNPDVMNTARGYLMRLFGVKSPGRIPPFISVHLRRGDFAMFTGGYTELDGYLAAIERVQTSLQSRIDDPRSWSAPGKENFKRHGGLKAKEYAILASTDEPMDSDFVRSLKALGWLMIDHAEMKTVEKKGPWWPIVLDAAILSQGSAFVGTHRSTFSYTASVRVKYWQGGVTDFADDKIKAIGSP